MTTYLGEKPVGIGTIKATEAVGKVITDKTTILGDGFTDPLKVNTLLFATSESVAASAEAIRTEVNNKFTVVDSAIQGANEAIVKTREDYIQADSEIHQMLNGLSAETTTIKNNQASLGTQVANIEHKIPDGTTGTNSLINKQILAQTSYTKAEVDAKVSSVYKFKGSVSTYNSLPNTATTGDVYNVSDTGANYAWDGSKWDKLSETIDLTAYATTEYVTAREQDIRSDLGENISEVHTQVVGLSGEVAKKLNSDGDTMTGPLEISAIGGSTTLLTLSYKATETSGANSWGFYLGTNMLNLSYNGTGFYTFSPAHVSPAGNGIRDLGQSYAKWKTLYATKLNNGADIAVPTTGGTMALESNVIELSESTVELATNTIYNAGEMAALTITFPTTDETYVSQLNFTSGSTATAFTAPDTVKWIGDDISDGAFVPATGKRYAIMFYYDGVQLRGAVQGA